MPVFCVNFEKVIDLNKILRSSSSTEFVKLFYIITLPCVLVLVINYFVA